MSSKENCKEAVINYLKRQNRPYSANDIMLNLHSEFGKTAIQKALDDLTSECKIREKVYGKQKVYAIIQEEDRDAEDLAFELQNLDSMAADAAEKLKLAEQEVKTSEAFLKELESQPTTDMAFKEKSDFEEAIRVLNSKIEKLGESAVEITEADKRKIYSEHEKFGKECRKRKKICMEIIDSILENYPKKKKVLFEEIGIEMDDDNRII